MNYTFTQTICADTPDYQHERVLHLDTDVFETPDGTDRIFELRSEVDGKTNCKIRFNEKTAMRIKKAIDSAIAHDFSEHMQKGYDI